MTTQTFPRSDLSPSTTAEAPASPQLETIVDRDGERFQCIDHVEQMQAFFFSVVSSGDHWIFAASNGALSAGRGSPDTALFPYYTVDKIIDNWNSTGPQTIIVADGKRWEPFKPYTHLHHPINQRVLKSINGDTVVFEETNLSLQLRFSYSWQTSERFGFIRRVKLTNLDARQREVCVVDGIRNFMPAGLDARTQLHYSCLGDAYKLSELDSGHQLLVHRMASALTDEAVPMESLLATTIWSHGWPESRILLKQEEAEAFLADTNVKGSTNVRAARGCFLNAGRFTLESEATKTWAQIADINQSQRQIADTHARLKEPAALWEAVLADIARGQRNLDTLVATADGQQVSEEEVVTAHHRANVLFNIMRGGVFANHYKVNHTLLLRYLDIHHPKLSSTHQRWLESLPETINYPVLVERARIEMGEPLARLCQEYLPLTFSRRHGDPSRPWNRFTIKTQDESGKPIVGFQGNWRDIFQNWEALAWSFPHYNEAFLTKFLNASTADGYNPYRITSEGIEWEKPDPDDPWASIGYWGDHQIIYLLKLLEFANDFDADSLESRLDKAHYVFADVPYEIKPFEQLEVDPKHSIYFNEKRDRKITQRVKQEGADGKLVHDKAGEFVQATLLEKLLIPLAVKLSNFVPGGGIWMNTQRPEWNDANNALAGFGLSMVTTAYLHRYIGFLEKLLETASGEFACHEGLREFIGQLDDFFQTAPLTSQDASPETTYAAVHTLGKTGEQYRARIYRGDFGGQVRMDFSKLKTFLSRARAHLLGSIQANAREDGLTHSYNVLHLNPAKKTATVERLGLMLEGQVAVLSSGAISPQAAVGLLTALARSPLYCRKRKSYILYTDKSLPLFLETNRVKPADARRIPLLKALNETQDTTLLLDSPSENCLRFHPALVNRFALETQLDKLATDKVWTDLVTTDRGAVLELYENTFKHRSFTGRSGSMFAYEGLGSIYWHMVSKLMLAASELALEAARAEDIETFHALSEHYYAIQNGLGFRKTPQEYGAFPADAYSHTPAHAGAQQPGLTGMVKEGILCRFAELGVSYHRGEIVFRPQLLREEEFLSEPVSCELITVSGEREKLSLPAGSLLFTLAQTPIIYHRSREQSPRMKVLLRDGSNRIIASDMLPADLSAELVNRTGLIIRIELSFPR